MTLVLQRATLAYSPQEDRIRLAGAGAGGPAAIWLTQRLLNRLVPALADWLSRDARAGMAGPLLHEFAQHAAQAALVPQAPVLPQPGEHAWLAISVELKPAGAGLAMRFVGPAPDAALLALDAQGLRQWLGMLHGVARQAGWDVGAWPAWLAGAAAMPGDAATMH